MSGLLPTDTVSGSFDQLRSWIANTEPDEGFRPYCCNHEAQSCHVPIVHTGHEAPGTMEVPGKTKLARWPTSSAASLSSLPGSDSSLGTGAYPLTGAQSLPGSGFLQLQLPPLQLSPTSLLEHTPSLAERPGTPPTHEHHTGPSTFSPFAATPLHRMYSDLSSVRGAWPSCDGHITNFEGMTPAESCPECMEARQMGLWEGGVAEACPEASDQQEPETCELSTTSVPAVEEVHTVRGADVSGEYSHAAKPAVYVPVEPIPATLIGKARMIMHANGHVLNYYYPSMI